MLSFTTSLESELRWPSGNIFCMTLPSNIPASARANASKATVIRAINFYVLHNTDKPSFITPLTTSAVKMRTAPRMNASRIAMAFRGISDCCVIGDSPTVGAPSSIGAALSKLEAELEQLRYVFGVERFGARVGEVIRNIGEVVSDVIAPRELVHLIEIADALGLDQGGDGAPSDSQSACLYGLELRSYAPVTNDIEAAYWVDDKFCVSAACPDLSWKQEQLVRRSALHLPSLS